MRSPGAGCGRSSGLRSRSITRLRHDADEPR
jgi:hypothetical protein